MANTNTSSELQQWQVDYKVVVRDYGAGFVEISLRRGINSCMERLLERSLDCTLVEYRACLTAMTDMLVLRSLRYTYQAGRARSWADA